MWDRMRDTRHGHRKEEMEGACVCCRQTSLETFIDRCVSERSCGDSGRTTKREKLMCPVDRMPREGEGQEGVCMHERKLVVATKVRGLCGCKRLTKIII